MKREELLQVAKPILFNTDMVREILGDRKTVTRRIVKGDIDAILNSTYHKEHPEVSDKQIISKLCTQPYQQGDILYVRETWNICNMCADGNTIVFIYKADKSEKESAMEVKVSDELYDKYERSMAENNSEWRPSIHMPKEAARIFIKVTDVRVERLQEITWQEAAREGCYGSTSDEPDPLFNIPTLRGEFQKLGDSTCKKNLQIHGWDANPWVWVIEFERVVEE